MRSTELTGIDDARKDPLNAPANNTEQRARFEADIADYYERMELNHMPDFTGRVINQSGYDVWVYKNPVMNNYNFGWQAANANREPFVVKLPLSISVLISDGLRADFMLDSEVKAAITAAGGRCV